MTENPTRYRDLEVRCYDEGVTRQNLLHDIALAEKIRDDHLVPDHVRQQAGEIAVELHRALVLLGWRAN